VHYVFESTGLHVIRLRVADGGQEDTCEVAVSVLRDYDGDGIPNDWEFGNGLNPLDLEDAAEDPDGDALSTYAEYRLGTDPHDADTDGDGSSDGEEFSSGTDPSDARWTPIEHPVLRVGAATVGFTVEEGAGMSEQRSFWVTNSGSGDFEWTAASDAPWLDLVPVEGIPPSEVTLAAIPQGLAVGTYAGEVVFTAPGALDSPQVLEVNLRVVERHFPALGFIRADSNMDLTVDIADAINTLDYLFGDGPEPGCLDAVDANDDGVTDIADAIYTLGYLFGGDAQPPAPFPGCGSDPTADRLGCEGALPCK
jgi:hypothetical protein